MKLVNSCLDFWRKRIFSIYLQGFFGNVIILQLPDDLTDNAHVDNLKKNHLMSCLSFTYFHTYMQTYICLIETFEFFDTQ